ncbi:MAG: hypothetical protein ACUVT3_02395 [Ignavibacterium sp.]
MKKLFVVLFAVVLTSSMFAQFVFDKDASGFHKKAVMVCGSMKTQSPDAQKVTEAINSAAAELEMLTQKYKNNPPAEYKNDPLWSSYFDDFVDNLTLVKTFADQKNYKIASKYSNTFCQIFGRMHRNNGTVDLTDVLFALNMQMKMTTDMSNAGNTTSAKENIGMIKKLLEQASNKVKASQVAGIAELFAPIEKTTNEWLKAIEKTQIVKQQIHCTLRS